MADVGIVMPVYRQNLDHLRIALRSVLTQSYRNFKFVIVGDGAPEDVTATIYEETFGDKRVQIVLKPFNEGIAEALNLGFDILMDVPGIDYLTWVSSDNYYYPNFLEVLHSEMLKAHDRVGLVYSSFRQILENGSPAHDDLFLKALHKWQNAPKERLLDHCIIGPAFLHRTSVCRKVGHYRLDPVQDYDYWIRMSEYCDIKYIPEELADYRLNSPFSLTTQIRNSRINHRKCWDAVHTAQYEARCRRGIHPEITVIYPVRSMSERTVRKLESVVDQFFSNMKLYIIDMSSDGRAKAVSEKIRDPRIRIRHIPTRDKVKAGLVAVKHAHTPYMILLRHCNDLKSKNYLKRLADKMAESKSKPISVSPYKKSPREHNSFGKKIVFGELYRTKSLAGYINKNRNRRRSLSKNLKIVRFY